MLETFSVETFADAMLAVRMFEETLLSCVSTVIEDTLRVATFPVRTPSVETFAVSVLLLKALKVVTLAASAVRVETFPVSVLLVKAL